MSIVNNNIYKNPNRIMTIINGNITDGSYPFQNETKLIIQRGLQEGFTIPPMGTLIIIDIHIQNLKNVGVWNKLDVYFEFAYNNTAYANFSKINWKKPTGTLGVTSGTITYTTSGWRGNGIDGAFDTGFNSTVGTNNYILNSACRFFTVYANTGTIINLDGVAGSINNSWGSGASQLRINGNGNTPSPLIAGLGFRAIARDSSTTGRIHVTSVITAVTSNSVALLNANQLILRSNTVYSDDGISNYAMGSSLTDTELQNIRSAYNTYLVRIGLTAFA